MLPSQPAWPPGQHQLQFDRSAHGVAWGETLFVTSNRCDQVVALSTRSGEESWRFSCDGPVRLAPVVDSQGVYVVSDDGCLYGLDRDTGVVRWRVVGAAGPMRRVLGNSRLISAWPARGGPVLVDGKIYFAAGIWPFLGIFLHAVDAQTGDILWTNSGDGVTRTIQPHGAPAFATVAPQGHLVATRDQIIVPGGRSVPAVYHREDGRLLHFQYDGKRGHHEVFTDGEHYYCGGASCALADGTIWDDKSPALGTPSQLLFLDGSKLTCVSADAKPEEKKTVDWKGKTRVERHLHRLTIWETTIATQGGRLVMQTGHQLWIAAGSQLERYDVPRDPASIPAEWIPTATFQMDANVWEVIAADDRLFAFLADGSVVCWATDGRESYAMPTDLAEGAAQKHEEARVASTAADRIALPPTFLNRDESFLQSTQGGYALVLGLHSGELLETLLRETDWHVVVLEESAELAQRGRRILQDRGLYGDRVAILRSDIKNAGLPDYFASYVTSERAIGDAAEANDSRSLLLRALRPFGGRLELPEVKDLWLTLPSVALADSQYVVTSVGAWTRMVRPASVPGTDDWTHQYGNAGQTGISRESLVRVPLGLLWFGGPSHDGILPRHGHGPSPQVAGGRIVIEGPDCLRCLDVYTGRLMWEKSLPGLGKYYDNTKHFPGAGEIGSNYVTLADRIYVVYGEALLELDAARGETLRTYRLNHAADEVAQNASVAGTPMWGYVGVWGNYLVTTSSPVVVVSDSGATPGAATSASAETMQGAAIEVGAKPDVEKSPSAGNTKPTLSRLLQPTRYASGSRRLHVFDRQSGRELWSRDAEFHFRHNALAMGNAMLFCIDRLSDVQVRALQRRGYELHDRPTLMALDLATGNLVWKTHDDVFGTFLSYSEEHDVLLQGGSVYRDRAYDESDKGMAAYTGRDGRRLWFEPERIYGGPCLLWKDRIITNGLGGSAFRLLDGSPLDWEYRRDYGCNTAIGCQSLLTFRTGAAGYCDLATDSGTGTLGGFRSSCTNNLIPANGVLAAPDYTRTCNCAYQNQTSLGLIHWPEAEFWTFGGDAAPGRWGINWGAPGDRRAENGTLWTDLPDVGGPSPVSSVRWEPQTVKPYRSHVSLFSGESPWICASGVEGIQKVILPSVRNVPHRLRLYFAEPKVDAVGSRRVFDVRVQGQMWLEGFSPAGAAGATRRGILRETVVEPLAGEIVVEFTSRSDLLPLVCGIELVEEDAAERQ